jgi:hypothetical protein
MLDTSEFGIAYYAVTDTQGVIDTRLPMGEKF